MKILSFGATDPGKKRANNEDSYLVNDELRLYAVADGVGGSEAGEVASRIAVDTIASAMPDLLGDKDRTPPTGSRAGDVPELAAFRHAVVLANRNIFEEAAKTPARAGMGTTLTALLVARKRAFLAHIGDSRAYRLRVGTLEQLTNDHSVVAEQVRSGVITAAQARTSPYRHVITRVLGTDREAAPDLMEQPVKPGDMFLLCSDGLTEMVDDREIGRILAGSAPRDAARKLIDAANAQGGVDNITAVVVQVVEV
ncbi:MAG: Stp1/IreP family PP2C-type Ser/Thr phosphatase [Nitrospirota bacterium]